MQTTFGYTLPQAYHNALVKLRKYGKISKCADWNCDQMECGMSFTVHNPLAEPMISKLFIGGFVELEQYRQEMLDGILDFEIEKGKWKYTYHDRMTRYGEMELNQINFVINELRRNPSSRRACIVVRAESDIGSKDPACLQHIQYMIRDGKLKCYVLFRSNDACKATFMNAFALIMLQKKIADALGVEVGEYTHTANSFHCYEKDFDLLRGYVQRIKDARSEEEVTYCYAGEWEMLMEAAKDGIAAKVEDLKGRL